MTTSRKIAVVINGAWRRYASIDFDGYCQKLLEFGHSPTLVLHRGSEPAERNFPVVEADVAEMENDEFWRSLATEAAIFFNWLRAPGIVNAMKQAGVFVISRGDTDGHASGRLFPKRAWLAMEASDDPIIVRLRKAKYLVERYLILSVAEDQALIETIDRSDAVAIECEEAAKNLRRILAHYKRLDLGSKVHVIPHSVRDDVLTQETYLGQRPRAIICGGRWSAAQKDAHLLAAALERLLSRQQDLRVVIMGEGADHLFERLASRFPGVNWLRQVSHEKVPALLTNCRIVVSSSRWEGYSILMLEALCMGCTLAAPPLPGFISMAENGRFGTISSRRNPASLVRAIETELELWDRGSRVPGDICAVWRKRTSNDSVVSDLLALIK
jgi:glycosyltransferase involved in cell wall biosynthesis